MTKSVPHRDSINAHVKILPPRSSLNSSPRFQIFAWQSVVGGFDLAFGAVLLLICFQYSTATCHFGAGRGQQPQPLVTFPAKG